MAEQPADDIGILVIGYNRPKHLESVLRSLSRQNSLAQTHIWIDGTQGRKEFGDANQASLEVARRFPVKELRAIRGHLGIEKLMLDALTDMSQRYSAVIVLEDDCFPLPDGISLFKEALAEVASREDVYSVYGHAFGTEPAETRDFTRFQGWGWAAHSARIRQLLPELTRLFLLTEKAYLHHIATNTTPEISARLDRTLDRNVQNVLKSFFSWDSATSFVTAQLGMLHVRTRQPAAINTGIIPGIGHFTTDIPRFRAPPFNMITVEEAFETYLRPTEEEV